MGRTQRAVGQISLRSLMRHAACGMWQVASGMWHEQPLLRSPHPSCLLACSSCRLSHPTSTAALCNSLIINSGHADNHTTTVARQRRQLRRRQHCQPNANAGYLLENQTRRTLPAATSTAQSMRMPWNEVYTNVHGKRYVASCCNVSCGSTRIF